MTNKVLDNPYVGPRTFTEAQSHLFFGREREARDLCARVLSERLVLFYAQSGAGKSSLINTRLIPQLREFGHAVLPVARVSGELPNGVTEVDNVYLFNLMLSLDSSGSDPGRFAHMQLPQFLSGLSSEDGRRFVYEEVVKPAQQAEASYDSAMPYVMIIDQFEELITSHTTHWLKREEFFRQLNQAMVDDPKLWVLLSFREDYLAPIETYAALMTDRMRARFYMERMDYTAALEAVKEPAMLAGRPFAKDVAEMLVDNLCQIRVSGQTETQAGQYVAPVQLQVVCYQLWEKLKGQPGDEIAVRDLEQAGNVDNALADFYELVVANAVKATGVSEIELRKWFDRELITETMTRGTVNQGVHKTGGLPNEVVKDLERQFLLRAENRAGGVWYELVHDRFVEPVRRANKTWFQQKETPFQRQAALWDKDGGLLLRDEALETAEKWAGTHFSEIEPHEKAFLKACQDAREIERILAEKENEKRRKSEEARREAEQRAEERTWAAKRLRRLLWVATVFGAIAFLAFFVALFAWKLASDADDATAKANKDLAISLSKEKQATNDAIQARDDADNNARKAQAANFSAQEALDAKAKANEDLEISLSKEKQAKYDAIQARDRANKNARIAHARQLAAQAITLATEQPDLALLLSLEAIRIDSSLESKSSLFTVLEHSTQELWRYLRGHDEAVWRLASNPMGDRLASADENGTVIIWNTLTQTPYAPSLPGHKKQIHSLSFNAKGDLLATIDDNGTLRLWNAETAKFLSDLESETYPFMRVAFSPDGRLLAAGKTDGSIALYDMSTFSSSRPLKNPVRELPATGKATQALVFSPCSNILVYADANSFRLWSTATGKPFSPSIEGHTNTIGVLAFSADGKTVATGREKEIVLWNVADTSQPKMRMHPLRGHTDTVTGVAFSPDDRVLYSTSGDRSVRMWDAATGQQIGRKLTGHTPVLSLSLCNDGNVLATGGMDGSIILWSIYAQQPLGVPLYGILNPVRAVAFSPNGRKLASAGQDGSVILWNGARQEQDGTQLVPTSAQGEQKPKSWVNSLVFHPQRELLYAGSSDGAIRVWDTSLHKENGTPMMSNRAVLSLALSHDGRFLASGDDEKNIIIWDLETREKKHPPLTEHTDEVWTLAFSADDTILASGSQDKSVRLWDVKSGESIGDPLMGYSERVSSMAFSPRNGFLYTASKDEIIRWDITRSPLVRSQLYKCEFKNCNINQLDFSPDGSVLAVGGGSTVIFIDPETGEAAFEPAPGIGNPIWTVAFDRQGKTVAAGNYGGNVTFWNPKTGKRFGRFMEGHHRDVRNMALSSDGKLLAFSSGDNEIFIREPMDSKSPIDPLKVPSGEKVTALLFNAISLASRQLFTASNDEGGRILSWDFGSKKPTSSQIARQTGYIHTLAITPNGTTLAAGSEEGGITLWDFSTKPPTKRALTGLGKDKPIYGLAFSKDGRLLASRSRGEFIIWNVFTGKQLGPPHAEKGLVKDPLLALQFSPTAPVLAVPSDRGDIILWDVSDPENISEKNRLRGHSGPIQSLSFSPNGKMLASGSYDHTVRLWDTDSGLPMGPGLMWHKEPIGCVVFSPDNKKFYSGGEDGLIVQWDVDNERLKLNAVSTVGRNLTEQEWRKYLPEQKYAKTHLRPLLLEANLLSLKGERTAAKQRYRDIVEMTRASNDAQFLNSVCWDGSINGYADIVMAACDRAVSKASSDNTENYRDTRGVARATANPPRIKEAIEDFQAFVGWTERNVEYTHLGNLRRKWIKELQDGRKPFDEETLRKIRNETIE